MLKKIIIIFLLTINFSVFAQEEKKLTFIQTGNTSADTRIIFIHGSPGDKHAFDEYLQNPQLQKIAELISVDRLGYGLSASKVEPRLLQQAQAIQGFLSDKQKNILVGHSLGGPIALQLALLEPSKVSGLLIVAPAFDPSLEAPKWFNHLANIWPVKHLLSKDLKHSNQEMMVLADELTLLAQQNWQVLNMPIILLHGNKDKIADPKNSLFAYKKLNKENTQLKYLDKEGHLVLWKNTPLVLEELDRLLDIIK